MVPQPPLGQGPVDPRGAFTPPPPPGMAGNAGGVPGGMAFLPTMPPPGYLPPPMMYPPPPQPPRGRSFAGAIFTTLASMILSASILLNVVLLFRNSSGGESVKQEVVQAGNSSQRIAVIPIHGIIDSAMVEKFEKMIAVAEEDSAVKAIVLDIDSPGGGVTSSDEIYARLLVTRKKKHVVATIGSLGASGGYYIACAAEFVFAEATSLTGSIGVIMPSYNVHDLIDKYGIKEATVTSDGATYKNAGSMFQPINERDQAYFKSIVNQAFTRFKSVVSSNRKLKGEIDQIANGKIYTADEALALGLIDQLGYPSNAWDKAAQLAGVADHEVVKYQPTSSWLAAFADSKFTGTPAQSASVQINGINVNVDRNLISELFSSRPMYMWRAQ